MRGFGERYIPYYVSDAVPEYIDIKRVDVYIHYGGVDFSIYLLGRVKCPHKAERRGLYRYRIEPRAIQHLQILLYSVSLHRDKHHIHAVWDNLAWEDLEI